MFCILTAAVFGRSTEIREQPNMSENAILREHLTKVASGDKAAFSELYDLMRTAVYGLALSYMSAAHDAQDITQDTLSASGNPPGSIVRPVRQSRGF